jgi:putative ABC transport system permease protein
VEIAGPVYLASAEILAHYGIDLAALPPGTEILTVETGNIWIPGEFDPATERYAQEAVPNALRLERGYASIPGTFITPDALLQNDWASVRAGWFIEADSPISNEQLAQARGIAAEAGLLVIESRSGESNLVAMRWPATAAGMLVALSILAMTVGLIRSESAGDLRTLTAAGATSAIRRTLSAATAGALALLGAALGTAGAYLVLIALYLNDISALSPAPVPQLLVIVIGIPIVAAGAGWLLAGREPPAIARQAIE